MSLEATTPVECALSLADYTRRALIVPQLRERDTAGIISELTRLLHRQDCVPDFLPFYQAALNQELLADSALDSGMALPHGRLNEAKRVQFALGRTRAPVSWCGNASKPVQLVFLLVVPATDATRYLQVRSSLACLGGQKDLLQKLRVANDSTVILTVLEQIKLRQG